ncbi:hypothetical protein F5Y04DRAFT_39693 [Hypomontagnella monticulosa]|nr:hypothetical protein F5Y04DRAFT_39693 [Hypomontagnella monticulosa]
MWYHSLIVVCSVSIVAPEPTRSPEHCESTKPDPLMKRFWEQSENKSKPDQAAMLDDFIRNSQSYDSMTRR